MYSTLEKLAQTVERMREKHGDDFPIATWILSPNDLSSDFLRDWLTEEEVVGVMEYKNDPSFLEEVFKGMGYDEDPESDLIGHLMDHIRGAVGHRKLKDARYRQFLTLKAEFEPAAGS